MRRRKLVLCVDGIIVKDAKMLLVKRSVKPFKGYWHPVGGHVDENETPKEALRREFKEETNLEVEVGNILNGRIELTPDRTKIIVVYRITSVQGEIKLNKENAEYKWFSKTPRKSVYNYDVYLNDLKTIIFDNPKFRV